MLSKLINFLLWSQLIAVTVVCPILTIIMCVYMVTSPIEVF